MLRCRLSRRLERKHFRAIAESSASWEDWLSPEGCLLWVSPVVSRITGYTSDECLAMRDYPFEIVHPDDRERMRTLLREALNGDPRVEAQFRAVRKDGQMLWCAVSWQRVADVAPHLRGLRSSIRDISWHITDRKNSETALSEKEEKLRDTQLKLRSLAEHLLSAREEERRKIAQEIHDELGQALTALKMDLHWIERRIEPSQEPVHKKMRSMAALIEQTILKVQRISSDLRPRMLDDLGLPPALEWLGGDFSRRTGIRCDVSVEVTESRIGGNSATTIFRVVQETLTNVARHARASRVSVTLREVGETLEMAITDDGVGISQDQASGPRSFGLIGLRERVLTLGGEISIRGEPGRGTIVAVSIPYPGGGDLA